MLPGFAGRAEQNLDEGFLEKCSLGQVQVIR